MSSQNDKILDSIEGALREQGFLESVENSAAQSVERLKGQVHQYLKPESLSILAQRQQEYLEAKGKLELYTDRERVKLQREIIADKQIQVEICFTIQDLKKQHATIEAQKIVWDFVKTAAQDFAVIAAKAAIKHGLRSL